MVRWSRESGRADVPFGHATVASVFSVAGKWLKMDGGLTRAAGYEHR